MKTPPREGETFVSRYRLVLERRATGRRGQWGPRLHRPELTAEWLTAFVAPYDRKILGALYLDSEYYLFGHHVAYVGTRDRLDAEPRGIFVPALLAGAWGIVVFQNHLCCGHPSPSLDDVRRQYHLRKAGDMIGIPVLDFLIIDAEGRFVRISLPRGNGRC